MTRTNLLIAGLALLGMWNQANADGEPVLNPASGPAQRGTAPAETAPVESLPVETAPAKPAPAEMAPSKTLPRDSLLETIQPGHVESAESAPAAAAPSTVGERWRYQRRRGRWWYWSPDQRWFYWDSAAWRAAPPAVQPYGGAPASAAAAFGPSVSFRTNVGINPDLIPVWRGPPLRFGTPPLPGMQRYNGEPYMYYYGRLYRIQGA